MGQRKTTDHLVRMAKALGAIILIKVEEARSANHPLVRYFSTRKAKGQTDNMTKREAAGQMAKEKIHMENLVARCMSCAERRGKVILKSDTGLTMEYQEQDLIVRFSLALPDPTNGRRKGTCFVRVKHGDNFVLEAAGNYLRGPYNINATTYAPGDWEERIRG